MERAAWTDERLDDLAESIRSGFARTDQDLRELRGELHTEIAGLRTEMHQGFASLRSEIDSLRLTMLRVGGVGFFGVIAAILARGA